MLGLTRSLATPIPGLLWQHPSNTAPRIDHIALAPGDDVYVGVHHSLPSGDPVIQPNVEAVWMEVLVKPLSGVSSKLPKCGLVIR